MFPLKCVSISGESIRDLRYRLCPNTEFSDGEWQIALSAVCIKAEEELNFFCSVNSNFSVDKRYSKDGEIQIYQQPLNTWLVLLKKDGQSVNRFSYPLWFNINRLSDEVIFTLCDASNEKRIDKKFKVVLNVLFRRVT